MTRIRFETGQVVNFNGVPTQADIDEVAASLKIQNQPVQQEQPKQKKDGILKSIAKDAAGTLLVKPAARATQAVTQIFFPKSQAAQGYNQLMDSGESQKIGGIEVNQAKAFGQGGGKQIVGEGLKSASYLLPYGKIAKGVTGAATPFVAPTVAKVAGNVVAGAAGGYTTDVAEKLIENKSVGKALVPGAGTAISAAIPLAGPILRAGGRLVSKTGSKLVDAAIPTSIREAQILQNYKADKPFFERVANVLTGTEKAPITAAKTALTTSAGQSINGLFGTKSQIGVQAKRASKSLWNDVISPRLKQSGKQINMKEFFAKKEADIIAKNPELSRQRVLLEALDAVKQDYKKVNNISLEQLQKYKEGWAKTVPEKAYRGKPIAGAFNDVRNELADEARQTIYNELGDDVKQAYFDYGNLLGLQEMGQVAMTGSKLKAGAGTFISEIASQAITPVATTGGQVVYRLGNGIQMVGKAGATTLGELLDLNADNILNDTSLQSVTNRINKSILPKRNKEE